MDKKPTSSLAIGRITVLTTMGQKTAKLRADLPCQALEGNAQALKPRDFQIRSGAGAWSPAPRPAKAFWCWRKRMRRDWRMKLRCKEEQSMLVLSTSWCCQTSILARFKNNSSKEIMLQLTQYEHTKMFSVMIFFGWWDVVDPFRLLLSPPLPWGVVLFCFAFSLFSPMKIIF